MAKRKTRKVTALPRQRSLRGARSESLLPVSTTEILSHPELLVLFATAPTGLGHLRVTQALRGGLPPAATPVLLGANDRVWDSLHRITSLHPLARTAFEWIQHGKQQDAITAAYRGYLKLTAPMYLGTISQIVHQQIDRPKVILAVATHYGLAHQLAALKERVWSELQVRLVVAVQVTDDSPQDIWFVPGADLIFVPSQRTRTVLLRYVHELGLAAPPFVVAPYPVSPVLAERLSPRALAWRQAQLDPGSEKPIVVSLPVSGAAVGLGFSMKLMDALHRRSGRFVFEVVSRNNAFTFPFLTRVLQRGFARVQASPDDREVVRAYERAYQSTVISLEVTKPSEQAFKALLTPDLRGGSILLFTPPVGRQEYDNLDFLRRHHLMPEGRVQEALVRMARDGASLEREGKEILEAARSWRALRLPRSAAAAAKFITWALDQRLLMQMGSYTVSAAGDPRPSEVSPDGVREFWDAAARYLVEQIAFPSQRSGAELELAAPERAAG